MLGVMFAAPCGWIKKGLRECYPSGGRRWGLYSHKSCLGGFCRFSNLCMPGSKNTRCL